MCAWEKERDLNYLLKFTGQFTSMSANTLAMIPPSVAEEQTPILTPVNVEEIQESQDPLVTVPPMKRQALELRVSAPGHVSTEERQVSTTVHFQEIRDALEKKRFVPTAAKELSEVVWLPRSVGRVGKKYVDVTITCVLLWESNGSANRTFFQDVVVGMPFEEFYCVAYMIKEHVSHEHTRKIPPYKTWMEDIAGHAIDKDDKRDLIYLVIDNIKSEMEWNFSTLNLGGHTAAFQRRSVREVVDMGKGMPTNANIAPALALARFMYGIIRIIIS